MTEREKELRQRIVNVMVSWLGKDSHKYIVDIYNSHAPLARNYKVTYKDQWCATTVSAASIECGYTDIIPTECGCERMIELLKPLGAWTENDAYTPKTGDLIFYDWDDSGKGDDTGWSDHVGIVAEVEDGHILSIEGNWDGGKVAYHAVKLNSKSIRGFGTPKYASLVQDTVYREYVVKKGDYLWKIASKYLGRGSRYPEIKKLNGLKSNVIYSGQVLLLPER